MIPEWLTTPRPPAPTGEDTTVRSNARIMRHVDKTMGDIARIGRESSLCADHEGKGLLQAVDPRVRIVTLLILIVAASFSETLGPLMFLCIMGVVFAALSRVSLVGYLSRVWLVVPLFSAAIALPATLNVITPGTMILPLFSLPSAMTGNPFFLPETVGVTKEGFMAALTLVLRAGASVSMAMLAVMTTPWHTLFKALRSLGVGRPFLMILQMTYRYLFVLLTAVEDMCLARKSRGIDESRLIAQDGHERGWVASRMGALFRKTRTLGHEVGLAMASRGFRGETRGLPPLKPGWADAAWSFIALVMAAAVAMDWI